jgi:hypothetical protein
MAEKTRRRTIFFGPSGMGAFVPPQVSRLSGALDFRSGPFASILPYLRYVRYPAHLGPASSTLRTSE